MQRDVFPLDKGKEMLYPLGYLNPVQRVIAMATALLMLAPGWITDLPGIILLVALYLWERVSKRREITEGS